MTFKTMVRCFVMAFVLFIDVAAHSGQKEFAITVGSDRRVYIIDLDTLEVIKKSETFPELGLPASIDYDQKDGRLYVGSGRGYRQPAYYPLTIFMIRNDSMKLINKFKLEVGETTGDVEDISEIYTVRLSPDHKKLYLMYGNEKYSGGSAVFDLRKMELQEGIVSFIGEDDVFSEDGKFIYVIIPEKIQKAIVNSQEINTKKPGRILTFDINANKKVKEETEEDILKLKRGFNPPHMKLNSPLLTTTDSSRKLEAHDRNSAKKLWEIDLDSKGYALKTYASFFSNNAKALIPMSTGDILVIDVGKGKILSRIAIGVPTTNVIVAKGLGKDKNE